MQGPGSQLPPSLRSKLHTQSGHPSWAECPFAKSPHSHEILKVKPETTDTSSLTFRFCSKEQQGWLIITEYNSKQAWSWLLIFFLYYLLNNGVLIFIDEICNKFPETCSQKSLYIFLKDSMCDRSGKRLRSTFPNEYSHFSSIYIHLREP